MLGTELHEVVDRAVRICLGVRVRLLNRVITGIYDDALRAEGLRIGQLNLLMAIESLGAVRPGRLAEVLRMDKSTVSRDLAHLRDQGWIETEGYDGSRGQTLRLTQSGRDILVQAMPAWESAQEHVAEQLGPDAVAAFKIAAGSQGFPPDR